MGRSVAAPRTDGSRSSGSASAGSGACLRRRRAEVARLDREGSERGSSIVEIVLVVPVVMIVLLVVVQCALWAHAAQVAQLAASEGDRVARSLGGSPASGATLAGSILHGPGADLSASSVAVDVISGDLARVTVHGDAVTLLPGFTLPVTSVQIGPIQEFRTSG